MPRALLLAHGKRRLTVHTAPACGAVTFPLDAHTMARAHRIQAVLWKAGNKQLRAQSLHLYSGFLVKYSIRDSDEFADFCASTQTETMLTNTRKKESTLTSVQKYKPKPRKKCKHVDC